MANITITLLTSKRTRQTIDSYDTAVAAQRGGYVVIEGENESTQIAVNYPEAYASQSCYVYMKNARGEYLTKMLDTAGQTKTFMLPAEMTYRGNTFLVFVAQSGDIITKWLPVVVPIAATGIDYHKVAVASEDFLKEVLKATEEAVKICRELQQQAKNGGFDGNSVFIRYSSSSDGAGMTETWTAGQRYIGVYVGRSAPAEPNGYNWALFVAEYAEEAVKICKELQQQAKSGGFDGNSVFIRYSSSSDGAGMTETWTAGQRYIGVYVGRSAPAEPNGYNWALFVAEHADAATYATVDPNPNSIDSRIKNLITRCEKLDTRCDNLGFKSGVVSVETPGEDSPTSQPSAPINLITKVGKYALLNLRITNYDQPYCDADATPPSEYYTHITIPEGFRPKENVDIFGVLIGHEKPSDTNSPYYKATIKFTVKTDGTIRPKWYIQGLAYKRDITFINNGWEIS